MMKFILVKGHNDSVAEIYFGDADGLHSEIASANNVSDQFILGGGWVEPQEKVFFIGIANKSVGYGPCSEEEMAKTKEVSQEGWRLQVEARK